MSGDVANPPFFAGKTILRDLRFSLPIWAFLAVTTAGVAWRGNAFEVFVIGIFAAVYVGPVVILGLGATLFSAKPSARLIRRVALQAFLLLLMAAPLPFLAVWVEDLSIRESQKRGDFLARLLIAYRDTHGSYPPELSELESEIPRPTVDRRFRYSSRGDNFEIAFSGGGFVTMWFRSADSTEWYRD